MVCTIRDRQGIAVAEEENSRSIWTSWISAYVRRYGEVIFIPDTTGEQISILVNDLKPEKAVSVENRIIAAFRKACRGKAEVQTESIPLKEWLDLPEELLKAKERRKKRQSGEAVPKETVSYKL